MDGEWNSQTGFLFLFVSRFLSIDLLSLCFSFFHLAIMWDSKCWKGRMQALCISDVKSNVAFLSSNHLHNAQGMRNCYVLEAIWNISQFLMWSFNALKSKVFISEYHLVAVKWGMKKLPQWFFTLTLLSLRGCARQFCIENWFRLRLHYFSLFLNGDLLRGSFLAHHCQASKKIR